MRLALILVVLLPFAAGCGAKQSDVAESGDAASDVSTSRVDIRVEDGKLLFLGEGKVDYAHDRGVLSMRSGPGGPAVPGDRMQLRFLDRTGYTGWTFSGRTRWEKESDTTPEGSDRFIPGIGDPAPQDLLRVLTDSSKEIEKLGEEEVRGVPARHYRAHFNRKELDEDLPERTEPVIDAWIDEVGVARRVRVPDSSGITTVDYFDFGVEVEVEAPPADELISEDEFWKLLEKWCQEQPKDGESLFCGELTVGEGSEGEGLEDMPVETEPAP